MSLPVPAISVAMSVYNGAPFLPAAIESILGQSFGDFEFLILDDGSRDGSLAIAQGYAAADARIRIIHRENRGLIVSLNELLTAARAPIIARMDADDIAMPDRFAQQIAFLTANPDYGVVGSMRVNIDEQGAVMAQGGPAYATDHAAFIAGIGSGSLLCHSAVMMRKNLAQSVGGYHAAFKHCEDLDLWLRMANITQICSLPEPLIHYRLSDDQVSKRHVVEQHVGAAFALAAYRERAAGRADPTATLTALPPIDAADQLFNRPGTSRAMRQFIVPHILYSPNALRGDAYAMIGDMLAQGGTCPGLWRAVLRLLRYGQPSRALGLAAKLLPRAFAS